MHEKRRRRPFRHLRKADRSEIGILLGRGYRPAEVATALGVSRSTVSRELRRRRRDGRYDAAAAEQKARVKRLHSKYQGMKVEALPPALREELIRELHRQRSPDEIAGRWKREGRAPLVGKDAIYRWLYSCWGNRYAYLLCTRRQRQRPHRNLPKREMIPMRIPLAMRPEAGVHGEADCFVSPRCTLTSASVAAVTERDSKYLWGTKLPNRKPRTMAGAMRALSRDVALSDLTLDNGIENRDHERFGLPAYFCDPHAPWQKPLIEQSIGLIRRWFFPKGTDLRTVTEAELQVSLRTLNGKWRKSLGYRSAYEVALERGILKQKIPDVVRGCERTPCCI